MARQLCVVNRGNPQVNGGLHQGMAASFGSLDPDRRPDRIFATLGENFATYQQGCRVGGGRGFDKDSEAP